MISKLAQSFVILSSLAVLTFAPSGAFADDKIKDSGSYDGTYTKRELLPIPDQEGHALMLTESTGSAVHPGGPLEGFSVVTREIADLRQGNGPHQGYVVFSKGDDQQVVRFEGTVTTTMKDGTPNTTMNGTYAIIGATGVLAGRAGEGTYAGYFTAEDKYQLNWDGHVTPQKGAMASPGKN
jgi:hypothetical protein